MGETKPGGEKVEERTEGQRALMASVVEQGTGKNGHALKAEVARPQKAMLALEMMAEGKTLADVRRETGFDFNTLRALKVRHEMPMAKRREELAIDGLEMAEGFRMLILKKQEVLAEDEEEFAKTTVRDLAFSYSMVHREAMTAMGENTQRIVVEHRRGPSIEEVQAEIMAAQERLRERERVKEIDVTPVKVEREES